MLGEQEDRGLRTEVARATKRLRELCAHLRRGEDDSGLQSDCDESMLVINLNNSEAEVSTNERETHSSPVSSSLCPSLIFFLLRVTLILDVRLNKCL